MTPEELRDEIVHALGVMDAEGCLALRYFDNAIADAKREATLTERARCVRWLRRQAELTSSNIVADALRNRAVAIEAGEEG